MSKVWYKKAQLWTAISATSLFLLYILVSLLGDLKETALYHNVWDLRLLSRIACLAPYIVVLAASVISNKLKRQTRAIAYLLVGMEAVLMYISRSGLFIFRPLGMFEVAGIISFESLCGILMGLLCTTLLLMPIAKKPVLIAYAGTASFVFFVDLILELYYGFFQFDTGLDYSAIFLLSASLGYQLTLLWFAFEMNENNRLHVYSKIFDFFIGLDYLDDESSEDCFSDDIYIDETAKFDTVVIDEDYDESCDATKRSKWIHFFDDLLLKRVDVIEIDGGEFLLDPLEESKVIFELQHGDTTATVCGKFTYLFDEDLSAKILRKRSVLNKTFVDIDLGAKADADIGVEYIEEGVFVICLKNKTFDVSAGNYDHVRDHMIRFLETIIIIQNTETCE